MLDLPPPTVADLGSNNLNSDGAAKPMAVRLVDSDLLQELRFPSFLKRPSASVIELAGLEVAGPRSAPRPIVLSEIQIPDTIQGCVEAFKAHTGASLVFSQKDTFKEAVTFTGQPQDQTLVALLDSTSNEHTHSQLEAAQELLRIVSVYPQGYLGEIGVDRVGLFRALLSTGTDGFRVKHPEYPDYYRFNGLTQGDLILLAARPGIMALTFHHEVGHAIDQARQGKIDRLKNFEDDNGPLDQILEGKIYFPPLNLEPGVEDRLAVKQLLNSIYLRSIGIRLEEGPTVLSGYSSKNKNELKAELFRFIVEHPSAFLHELTTRPRGKTAQTCQLLLSEMTDAAPMPIDAQSWLVALAERQSQLSSVDLYKQMRGTFFDLQGKAQIPSHVLDSQGRYQPDKLVGSLQCFVELMKVLKDPKLVLEGMSNKERYRLAEDCLISIEDLGHTFNTGHLAAPSEKLAAGTKLILEEARKLMSDFRAELGLPSRLDEGLREFQVIKVDRFLEGLGEISDLSKVALRRALMRSMAATVWVQGGSGVLVHESGVVLTNQHVVRNVGDEPRIIDALGREFKGLCLAASPAADLSLVRIIGDHKFPWMPLAPFDETPTELARYKIAPEALIIGHPVGLGACWQITAGPIVRVGQDMPRAPDNTVNLGNLEHQVYTYWGNSGSPGILIVNGFPTIGFIHNSYLEEGNRRFGISLGVIVSTLKEVKESSVDDVAARQLARKLVRNLVERIGSVKDQSRMTAR